MRVVYMFFIVIAALIPAATGRALADTCSEIVIGAALSLTGAHATGGIHTRNGYEFAVGQIRSRGGIKVGDKCVHFRVIYADAESQPGRAADVARRLIKKDRVQFLLGPYDATIAKAIAAVAVAHKTPLVTAHVMASAPGTAKPTYVFGTLTPADYDLGLAIDVAAKIAANTGRSASTVKIAIASAAEITSAAVRASIVDRAAHYDMRVMLDEPMTSDPVQLRASFDKIKRGHADVLIVSAGADGAIKALRHVDELQLRVPMIVMTNCRGGDLAVRYTRASQNLLCATRWRQSPADVTEVFANATEFDKIFKTQFKNYVTVPDEVTNAATALYVYAKALERSGSRENEQVRVQLAQTNIMTLHGPLKFSGPLRKRVKRLSLMQIVDGSYRPVAPEVPANHQMHWPRAGL